MNTTLKVTDTHTVRGVTIKARLAGQSEAGCEVALSLHGTDAAGLKTDDQVAVSFTLTKLPPATPPAE